MVDESQRCAICHEELESYHQVVQPNNCSHTFHAICIHIWVTHYHNCPICHTQISYQDRIPWQTVFMTALVVTQETALERAAYTYAFLSAMLRRFSTSEQWNHANPTIVAAAEQLEAGMIRLPYLHLQSRTTAKQEKQKWATIFKHIQEDGQTARSSPRVKAARRWIVDQLFFMFAD
jgi:hypothetical protein